MAALADLPGPLDLRFQDDRYSSLYSADLVNNLDPTLQAMSGEDYSSFHSFLQSEPNQPSISSSGQSASSGQHETSQFEQKQQQQQHYLSQNPDAFTLAPSLASSSSDTSTSLRSADSSSISSPQLRGPYATQILGHAQSAESGYFPAGDVPSYHPAPVEADFADYEKFLAGEGASSFVGTSQDPPSSPAQVYGLFPNFQVSSMSSQVGPYFKKPSAPPSRTGSYSNQPAGSPLGIEPVSSESMSAPGARAAASRSVTPARIGDPYAVRQPTRSAMTPPPAPSPHNIPTTRQDWASSQAAMAGHGFLEPESKIFPSPSLLDQESADVFPYSPSLPSQFFHQSSGNFMPPLESSCSFSLPPAPFASSAYLFESSFEQVFKDI